jgi:hypothetical protein
MDKHSSLSGPSINYAHRKFYNIGPEAVIISIRNKRVCLLLSVTPTLDQYLQARQGAYP